MKIIVLIAIFAFGLLLVGCAGNQPQTPPAGGSPEQNANPNQQAQPPAVLTREEICNKIQGADYKNWCLGFVTGKSSYCDSIAAENDRNDCYGVTGMNAKDVSVCEKMTNVNKKQTCLAVARDDIKECDATDQYGKERCVNQFAAYTKDLSVCGGAEGPTNRENCYYNVAKSTGDEDACAQYTVGMKDKCYFEVSRTIDDIGQCGNIVDSGMKATCTAVAKKDYSLCPANDSNCMAFVAMAKSDWGYCDETALKMQWDSSAKDACYMWMAVFRLERNLV
jgi:hypothetical protein